MRQCWRYKELYIEPQFDYSRSVLFVPSMRTNPTQGQVHIDASADLLAQLILPSGDTLVLFNSRHAMQSCVNQLPYPFYGFDP